jgi:hypothetical protein
MNFIHSVENSYQADIGFNLHRVTLNQVNLLKHHLIKTKEEDTKGQPPPDLKLPLLPNKFPLKKALYLQLASRTENLLLIDINSPDD